jgi:hypothetical protein
VPLTKSQLQRFNDCLDVMSKRMDEMEAQRQARWDSEDRELEEELARGNTMPTPTPPFSDGAPQRIHGEPSKKDLFG